MKTRLAVLFLAFFLIGPPSAIQAEEIKVKPALSVSASNGHVDIEAVDASFKDVLRKIESKAGVKVVIFDSVEDRKVSLSIKSLPAFSLGTMLKQMGLKNHAVVYDSTLAALVVYVLPEGADISAVLKGKHVIGQADFPNPADAISVKGKSIETIRKSPDGSAIRYFKDEILIRFYRGNT